MMTCSIISLLFDYDTQSRIALRNSFLSLNGYSFPQGAACPGSIPWRIQVAASGSSATTLTRRDFTRWYTLPGRMIIQAESTAVKDTRISKIIFTSTPRYPRTRRRTERKPATVMTTGDWSLLYLARLDFFPPESSTLMFPFCIPKVTTMLSVRYYTQG